MKKNFILLLAMILILSGCGNTMVSGMEEEVPVSEEAIVLTEGQQDDTEKAENLIFEEPESSETAESSETEETPEPEESAVPVTDELSSVEPSETEQAEDSKSASTSEPTAAQKPSATETPSPASGQSQEPAPTPEPVHTCSWDGGTVTQAATCTGEGVMTYTCTSCGKTRTESIAKTDHSWVWNWTITEKIAGQCLVRYRTVDICSDCGYILNTYVDDTVEMHNMGAAVKEGGPVCTAAVKTTYTCQDCGLVESYYDEPTGHQPESWDYSTCRICGAHIAHVWVEGKCYCGAVQEE